MLQAASEVKHGDNYEWQRKGLDWMREEGDGKRTCGLEEVLLYGQKGKRK